MSNYVRFLMGIVCVLVVIVGVIIAYAPKEHKTLILPEAIVKNDKHAPGIATQHKQPGVLTNKTELSDVTKRVLRLIQDAKNGRLHANTLEDATQEDESSHIIEVESYLRNSIQNNEFNDEDEDNRILIIDYLGEKLRGRLPTQYRSRIWNIFQDYIAFDVLNTQMDERKKKSLIGDKVEIMEYVALWSENDAIKTLRSYQGRSDYDFLRVGVSNGLYKQGNTKEEIADKLES